MVRDHLFPSTVSDAKTTNEVKTEMANADDGRGSGARPAKSLQQTAEKTRKIRNEKFS